MILTEKQQKYHEYLTVGEIVPSDQRIMIEQPKFTQSPLLSKKHLKNKYKQLKIKEKTKAHENHGKQLVKSSSEKESLTLLKQKEIFEELANERINETNEINEINK